ncbi:hypothetical protein LINGRAPRIM_LOCUS2962 [Linum grandiflorum]
MLEGVRSYMMKRIVTKHQMYATNVNGFGVCPRIVNRLEKTKYACRLCTVTPSMNQTFEVGVEDGGYVVNLATKSCTCGYWDLSGIPCLHAVSCISYMRADLFSFVYDWYSIENARKAYSFGVPALVGRRAWPETEGLIVYPPVTKALPGRPKKAWRKEAVELESRPTRNGRGTEVGRKGLVMHCTNCDSSNHNVRTCKEPRRAETNRAVCYPIVLST